MKNCNGWRCPVELGDPGAPRQAFYTGKGPPDRLGGTSRGKGEGLGGKGLAMGWGDRGR